MTERTKDHTRRAAKENAPVAHQTVAAGRQVTAGEQPVERVGNRGVISDKMKAHAFKPGQSGNPSGRPKVCPITDVLRDMLCSLHPDQRKYPGMTSAEALAQTMLNLAIDKSDMRAAMEIADRVEGRVPQGLQHTGPAGGAVAFTTVSPDENDRRIAELLAKSSNWRADFDRSEGVN